MDATRQPAGAQRAPHARSASELKQIIDAERDGRPFLLWRDQGGEQRIVSLDERPAMTVGRRADSDVRITEDSEISRTHAQLECVGGDWMLSDDGLSRNGTYVNGSRISRRTRLSDGDVLRFGTTIVEYRRPNEGSSAITSAESFIPTVDSLTDAQRKILIALCRPFKNGTSWATPATNNEIANEVFLGIDAVKRHLGILFQRFEIAELPQNQKRARLVECAFQWGLVSERDL